MILIYGLTAKQVKKLWEWNEVANIIDNEHPQGLAYLRREYLRRFN